MDIGLRALLSGFDEAKQKFAELNKEIDKSAASVEKLDKVSGAGGGGGKGPLGPVINGATEGAAALGDLSGAATMAAGVLGAGLAAAAAYVGKQMLDGFNNVRNLGEELGNLSARTGFSVESLGSLQLAAKTNNLSIEALGMGVQQFNRHIIDATKEAGASAEAFTRLGVSVREPHGALKDSEVLLGEVADKFARMEDGAGKTALAMELFGRAGANMIPLLNEGSGGLAKLADEARKAGIVLSTETSQAAKEFNANLEILKSYGQGFWMSVASPVVEGLAKITTAMREARREGDGFFGSLFEGMKKAAQMAFGVGDEKQDLAGTISSLQGLYAQRAKAQGILDGGATGTARKIALGQIERLDPEITKLETHRNNLSMSMAAADPNASPKTVAPTKTPKPGRVGGGASREMTEEQIFAKEERYFKNLVTIGEKAEEELITFYQGWADRAGKNADLRVEIEARSARLFTQIEDQKAKEQQKIWDAQSKSAITLMRRQEAVESDLNKKGVEEAVTAAEARLHARQREIQGNSTLTEQQKLDRLEALREEMKAEGYLADFSKEWRTRMAKLDNDIADQKVKVANETANQINQIFGKSTDVTVDLFKGMHKGLTGVFEDILHGNLSLTKSISGLWSSLVDSTITTLAQLGSKAILEPIFTDMKGVLDPLFKDIGSMLKDAFSSAWDWVKGLFTGTDWGSLFSGLTGGVGGIFDSIGSRISGGSGGGGGGGGGGLMTDIFGEDLGPIASIASSLFGFFPTGTDMVVSKPTAFIAGDAGSERVTVSPLSGAARHGMGGGTVVFQGPNIIDEYTMRRFKRQLGLR